MLICIHDVPGVEDIGVDVNMSWAGGVDLNVLYMSQWWSALGLSSLSGE